MTINLPDPCDGWRLLEEHEHIEEGDETGLLSGRIIGWVRCGFSIGKTVRDDRESQGEGYRDRAFYRRRTEEKLP
jgi:hypothetical protein